MTNTNEPKFVITAHNGMLVGFEPSENNRYTLVLQTTLFGHKRQEIIAYNKPWADISKEIQIRAENAPQQVLIVMQE